MTEGKSKQPRSGENQAGASGKKLANGLSPDVGKATQFEPGRSGNPSGRPKGIPNLSTRIREMLNDDDFTTVLPNARTGWEDFKGAPAVAIIKTAMIKAIQGDEKARDWLAKYGYGTKIELEGDVKAELTIKLVDYSSAGDDSV